ncbi:adenylate/guanylate cyclase domain-containing protein, partial [Candidatus Peregrinibacteria bacterium]|nr:adenylate/guanylate cyclase domain-containing protein [Candidatus Peregrinibacteria bacterium]
MNFGKFFQNRLVAGLFIAAAISLFLGVLLSLGVFDTANLKLRDSLYTYNKPSDEIVIIAIDEKSTKPKPEGLERFSKWTRTNYVELLNQLSDQEAKVILFDILFVNRTENISFEEINEFLYNLAPNLSGDEKLQAYEDFLKSHSNAIKSPVDLEFALKLGEFKNIILAYDNSPEGILYPIPELANTAKMGDRQGDPDEDGVFRKDKVMIDGKEIDSLAIAAAKQYLGEDKVNLPLVDGDLWVNYFADPYSYQMISFVDVMNGKFEKGFFKDKIVLIGLTTFREVSDVNLTPKSNEIPMPGVEIWANEIQTIIDGKFLHPQGFFGQIITLTVIAIVLTVTLNYLGILSSIILSLAAILLYLGAAHFAYRKGILLNMVYPFIAIVLVYLGSWVYKFFVADRKKREITLAFGKYVSKELVDQISKNPDLVKLGGEKKMVTVFFSDIKNSTTHSENTPIEAWVSQINEYFTAMEAILKRSGGTLDKYEGDAIMGFWNAPIDQPDHISRAYATAIAMQKTLKQLHQKWQQEGKPLIEFRIGINTGDALVGNFGSTDRFDYTVMGDTVNTASRFESSANKVYGTSVIVGGVDCKKIAQFITRELDTVLLPGKNEPVKVFELICIAQE